MRRGNFFWGVLIVLAGVLLLLDNMGLLPRNAWSLIWPLGLVLLGLWFLFGVRLFRGKVETQQLTIPLEAARQVDLTVGHGAGRLEIGAHNRAGDLLFGTFDNGVESSVHRNADHAEVKLRPLHDLIFHGVAASGGLTWRVLLSSEVSYRMKIQTGASESKIDLTDLLVSDLRVETGASSTSLTLPARAGFTSVKVESGVAEVNIYIPDGVAAQIHVAHGLSSVNIDPNRFPRSGGDYFATPGYESAPNRAEIRVETGMGAVNIR